MDNHKLWRIVGNNLRGLRDIAPDGYAPVVEVFLVGRPEPIRLTGVQTERDPDFPWTLLIAETGDFSQGPSQVRRSPAGAPGRPRPS